MAKKYMATLDADGKFLSGTVLEYPDEYTNECTEEVFNNQNRAQFVNGAFIIHDLLALSGPITATVGEELTYTVTLPADSPDTEVSAQVGQSTDLGTFPITSGQATIPLSFDAAGTYLITASSRFNGSQTITLEVS